MFLLCAPCHSSPYPCAGDWQAFAAEANANYSAAAGVGATPPVLRVSSWDWVAAATETRMVASTAWAFVISLGISAVCIFAFTGGKAGTTLAAFLCILCVNLCLVAGMVVGLQWTLGAVEAVSITVFVGKRALQHNTTNIHRIPGYIYSFWLCIVRPSTLPT